MIYYEVLLYPQMNGTQINMALDPRLTNLATPSWDSFLVLFYIIAVIIYAFFANRERLTVVLISVYSSLALTIGTPIISQWLLTVDRANYFTYRLGIFIGAFLVLYLLFANNMNLRSEIGHKWWQAFILSCLQVGLLISSILLFLPPDKFESSVATYYFTADAPRSFWMLAPIVAMVLLRPKQKDRGRDLGM